MIPFVFITGDQSPLEDRVLLRLLLLQLFGSECVYKEANAKMNTLEQMGSVRKRLCRYCLVSSSLFPCDVAPCCVDSYKPL